MLRKLSVIFEDIDQDDDTNILKSLQNYVRGNISKYELDESDTFIDYILERYKRHESEVFFNITSDYFFEKLGYSSDDKHFLEYFNHTHDFEYRDFNSLEYDFEEGYSMLYEFNNENLDKFKTIVKTFYPYENFDLDFYNNNREEINNLLKNTFEEEIDSLLNEYKIYTDDAFYESIKKGLDRDFYSELKEYGIIYSHNGISSKVSELIKNCYYFNYIGNLEGLFDIMVEKLSHNISGDFYDVLYDYYDDTLFDSENYNHSVSNILDDIIEKMDNHNILEFTMFIKRISDKFKPKIWFKLPKDENINFRIEGFNLEDFTISVIISSKKGITKKNFYEEDFFNFLYQPELFDLEY